MALPLVAVIADTRQIDGAEWHAASTQYLTAAFNGASVMPIIIPALGAAVVESGVFDLVDGILLTGSKTNVHPSLYGGDASEANGPYDPARDATAFAVIRSLAGKMPLLAICRGMQELNVALGGSLVTEVQDQPGKDDHRAPVAEARDARFALRHGVEVAANSCLSGIVGTQHIDVNSLHRQAVDRLAPGLRIDAQASDGVVEAVSMAENGEFSLGVQWHPEYWVETDLPSSALFQAFGDAVRRHAEARRTDGGRR